MTRFQLIKANVTSIIYYCTLQQYVLIVVKISIYRSKNDYASNVRMLLFTKEGFHLPVYITTPPPSLGLTLA